VAVVMAGAGETARLGRGLGVLGADIRFAWRTVGSSSPPLHALSYFVSSPRFFTLSPSAHLAFRPSTVRGARARGVRGSGCASNRCVIILIQTLESGKRAEIQKMTRQKWRQMDMNITSRCPSKGTPSCVPETDIEDSSGSILSPVHYTVYPLHPFNPLHPTPYTLTMAPRTPGSLTLTKPFVLP